MKLRPALLSLVFFLSIISCEKDEETSVRLVNLTVDPSFQTDFTEDWIIIHDENGAPLAHRSFESNDNIVINSKQGVSGATIGVTLLRYSENFTPQYTLYTYHNLKIGREINVHSTESPTPDIGGKLGNFKVKLDLGNSVDQYWLTDKFGQACAGSGDVSGSLYPSESYCNLYEHATRHLIEVSNKSGDIRYKMLDNVKPNDSYVITYNDLSAFDKTVDFNLTPGFKPFLLVTGREPGGKQSDPGYVLQLHYGNDSHNVIKAGYLNSLSKYYTQLTASYTGYVFTYINRGSIPGQIAWPSPTDYKIISTSLADFSCTASKPFVSQRSSHYYRDPVNSKMVADWYVRSSATSHKLQDLPGEILSKYPVLKLSNFTYSTTTFDTQAQPYESLLTPQDPESEYVIVSINIR